MPEPESVRPPEVFPNLSDDIDRIVAAAPHPRHAVLVVRNRHRYGAGGLFDNLKEAAS